MRKIRKRNKKSSYPFLYIRYLCSSLNGAVDVKFYNCHQPTSVWSRLCFLGTDNFIEFCKVLELSKNDIILNTGNEYYGFILKEVIKFNIKYYTVIID